MNMQNPWIRYILIFLSGAVMALAMPPTAWWPLSFVGLSSFYVLLAPVKGWRGFLCGWLFGFGYFLAGLYWISNALLVPGNEFKWVWPLAIIGLPVGLAIFTGLAAWLITRCSILASWRGFTMFVTALLISEWLRGHILTGFPWNLYGYAWSGVLPMVQSVSLFGVYGLTLLTILWCTLPGFLYVMKPQRKAVVGIILLSVTSMAGLYGWGALRLHNHQTEYRDDIIVRLVQPNIPQEDKWNSDRLVFNLKKTVDMSSLTPRPGKTMVIVWPETAISDFVMQDPNAADYIRTNLFNSGEKIFLATGVLRHGIQDNKPLYFNSLGIYGPELKELAAYDKSHLVPFGEYIPFQDKIPLNPFVNFGSFTPGTGITTQTVPGLPPFSGLICYEVIFPGSVALTTPRPEWIINVTNDAWYGDSPGPYQHLVISQFRAVEEGLPLARSANTGISAIIDPFGRIITKFPYGTDSVQDQQLPVAASLPPFAKWRDWPLLFAVTIAFFVIFRTRSFEKNNILQDIIK